MAFYSRRNEKKYMIKQAAVLSILLLLFTGCGQNLKPHKSILMLSPKQNNEKLINADVWVKKVRFSVTEVGETDILEKSLALNIIEFMRTKNCFKTVNSFPGSVKHGDLIFNFKFTKYITRVWWGTYFLDFECELIVTDILNRTVFNKTATVDLSISSSSAQNYLPYDARPRTRLIEVLIEEFVKNYNQMQGIK